MNLRTILKYLIYACACVPLVIFSEYISPFHFGKVVVFRSLVELMLIPYVLLVWNNRSYRFRTDKIFWPLLGFTLAYTITTFTSINTYQSFWGTLERMGGLWSFWHYFIFYIIITSVLQTKEEWFRLFKVTVVVGVLSALYGFGQRTDISFFIGSGGRTRIFGTIGNAALFAGYQIFNVFIALILAFTAKEKVQRNMWLGASVLMTVAVFMTAVRGSILGISLGFVVFAFLYFLQGRSYRAKQVFVSLLVLGVLFVVASLTFKDSSFIKSSPYLSRVTDFSLSNRTVETRFWAWEAGLNGWKENPKTILVGWGPENFNIPFSKYFNPLFFRGPSSETLFDRAHNMFVEILVTMGLVGLITYISIFGMMFFVLWRLRHDPEKRIFSMGLIAMTIAYMVHNAFIFDTSANFIVFFTILGFTSFVTQNQIQQQKNQIRKTTGLQRSLIILLLIAILVLVYRTNIIQSKANRSATRGIVAGWNDDFDTAMVYYKTSVGYGVPGKYEERNRLAQYLLDYSVSKDTKDLVVVEAFKFAIQEEEKNALENHQDYLPELYLSRLNIILGKDDPKSPYNDVAIQHAQKALSYSETFVRTYYEIGQGYLNKKDYVRAKEAFQKAIDLNPNVGLSYWYLGVISMQEGKVDQGLELINQAVALGYGLGESEYLNLAGIYIKRSDFANLVSIYESLVRIDSKNPQYIASLAVTYARVGRIDEAVATARLAAQVDPSFAGEAKKFVEQLGRVW